MRKIELSLLLIGTLALLAEPSCTPNEMPNRGPATEPYNKLLDVDPVAFRQKWETYDSTLPMTEKESWDKSYQFMRRALESINKAGLDRLVEQIPPASEDGMDGYQACLYGALVEIYLKRSDMDAIVSLFVRRFDNRVIYIIASSNGSPNPIRLMLKAYGESNETNKVQIISSVHDAFPDQKWNERLHPHVDNPSDLKPIMPIHSSTEELAFIEKCAQWIDDHRNEIETNSNYMEPRPFLPEIPPLYLLNGNAHHQP